MAKHPAKCPRCGKALEFDTAADEKIVCPGCQALLSMPGKFRPSDKPDPLLGQTLGQFELIELLGRGGMGAVYKARQTSLDRFVAVKVLPRSVSRDPSFVERFQREARSAGAVIHPNIIQVYDVGQDKGFQFISMELVEGESLADLLKREGALPPARAVDLFKQVASALAKAHAAGIIHRDIKPSNILLTPEGLAKVADFGLAKREGVDISVTQTGDSLGTPLYMPPEVCRGEKADARSDLYSLGATFYQALAGKPPFHAATPAAVLAKHLEAEVPPLAQAAPGTPPDLCRIIHRLLRKKPADRFQSADELLEALRPIEARFAAEEAISTVAVPGAPAGGKAPSSLSRRERERHAHRRKLLLFGGLASAFVVLVLLLVLVFSFSPRPQATTPLTASSSGTPTPNTQHPTPSSPAPGPWTVYTEWPFDAAEATRRQKATADALGAKVEQDIELGNGVKMTLVLIPAGEFLMGSPPSTTLEELAKTHGGNPEEYFAAFPQHRVRISRPFWLGKTEVTQEQWQAVTGKNPSENKASPLHPVETVTWTDCQGFLQELSGKTKGLFRLPTEAEWEYACRAGTPTEFSFGDSATHAESYAWYGTNSENSSHPVARLRPNAWGLSDMAGNLWEWCEDSYSPYGDGPQTDPKVAIPSDIHVVRGGSWSNPARTCRSTNRMSGGPRSSSILGLRVARPAGDSP